MFWCCRAAVPKMTPIPALKYSLYLPASKTEWPSKLITVKNSKKIDYKKRCFYIWRSLLTLPIAICILRSSKALAFLAARIRPELGTSRRCKKPFLRRAVRFSHGANFPVYPHIIYLYKFTSKYNLLMSNVIELSIWWRISLNFHITNCTYDFVIDLPASICLTHDSEKGIAMVLSRLELQRSARYVDISNYVVVWHAWQGSADSEATSE